MSEHQKPEEPLIIKTDRPHTVSMTEGSNVAAGKKAEAMEPSVRKVLADGEGHAVEHMVMDGGVSKSADQNASVNAQDANFKGYQGAADVPDRFVAQEKNAAIPAPARKPIDVTKLDTILKTQDKPTSADTVDSPAKSPETAPEVHAEAYAAEPEMDFPARVINIKIENDQLRERLDKLE